MKGDWLESDSLPCLTSSILVVIMNYSSRVGCLSFAHSSFARKIERKIKETNKRTGKRHLVCPVLLRYSKERVEINLMKHTLEPQVQNLCSNTLEHHIIKDPSLWHLSCFWVLYACPGPRFWKKDPPGHSCWPGGAAAGPAMRGVWGCLALCCLANKEIKSLCTCYNISTVSSQVGDEAKSEIRADRGS
jgi:hypothetical protein